MKDERLITPVEKDEDRQWDRNLRPQSLKEYAGQKKIKEKMAIFIKAALKRKEPLDHVLLHGPPGLGKTTLASIIAHEMNVKMHVTSGPAIERPGDLAAILTNLRPKDILFIDEVHRLNRGVEEILYPAMEDYALDIIIGKGPSARSIRLDLPFFTLVGATTRVGLLTSPLRNRFGVTCRLEFYTEEELKEIILRAAKILSVSIEEEGAREIARCSRGTPRIANRLLKRVRDFAEVKTGGIINREVAREALALLEFDENGLDNCDRRLISAIIHKFDGGPVGVETLSAVLNEEPDTIEDVYEPYLMQIGYIKRTPRGRVATPRAYRHFNLTPKLEKKMQAVLFSEED